jgi:hypothetical protein
VGRAVFVGARGSLTGGRDGGPPPQHPANEYYPTLPDNMLAIPRDSEDLDNILHPQVSRLCRRPRHFQ